MGQSKTRGVMFLEICSVNSTWSYAEFGDSKMSVSIRKKRCSCCRHFYQSHYRLLLSLRSGASSVSGPGPDSGPCVAFTNRISAIARMIRKCEGRSR